MTTQQTLIPKTLSKHLVTGGIFAHLEIPELNSGQLSNKLEHAIVPRKHSPNASLRIGLKHDEPWNEK